MVRRALLRSFRGLCLICFCIVVLAIAVAILELVSSPFLGKVCGSTEIIPMFSCGHGWVWRLIEIAINLPFLFFYALLLTASGHSTPNRAFMALLYSFDVIFVLAGVYFSLWFIKWREVEPNR